jgi:hypothetical protein
MAGTKCDFGEVENTVFQASPKTANSFSAFWEA